MSQLQEKVTQENEDNSRYDPKASELPLNAELVGKPVSTLSPSSRPSESRQKTSRNTAAPGFLEKPPFSSVSTAPAAELGKKTLGFTDLSRKRVEGSGWQTKPGALQCLNIEHPFSFLHIYY